MTGILDIKIPDSCIIEQSGGNKRVDLFKHTRKDQLLIEKKVLLKRIKEINLQL